MIKKLRTEKKLSQQKLADQMKVSRSTVAMWETNQSTPDAETYKRLADFFGVSVDYLLGRTDQPTPPETKKEAADITFDDFTYAFYGEAKDLSEENKQQLLNMAKFLRQQQELNKK